MPEPRPAPPEGFSVGRPAPPSGFAVPPAGGFQFSEEQLARDPQRRTVSNRLTGPIVVPPTINDRAQALDISTEGAPLLARQFAGFAPRTEEGLLNAAKAGLRASFGVDVEVNPVPELDGEIIFRNPETGDLVMFDPGGPEFGDVRQLGPEALPFVGEVAGAVAGASTGPQGAILAGAGGAFFGELVRLARGKEIGAHDLDTEQMLIEAGKIGGLALLGGEIARGLSVAGRAFLNRNINTARKVLENEGISTGLLDDAIEETGRVQSRIASETGEAFDVTAGQSLRTVDPDAAARLESFEEGLSRGPGGGPLRGTRQAQQRRIRGQLEATAPATTESAEQVGAAVRRSTRRADDAMRQASEDVEGAIVNAERSIVNARTAGMSPDVAGGTVREMLSEARTALNARMSRTFQDIEAEFGEAIGVDVTAFRKVGAKFKGQFKRDLVKTLSSDDAKLAAEVAEAGLVTRKTPFLDIDLLLKSLETKANEPVPLSVVQRALSDIRTELRMVKKNLSPRRNIIQLVEMEKALRGARNNALRQNPNLLRRVLRAEKKFAQLRSRLDRSEIGALLRPREGGGFALRDEQVVPRILNNPTLAREVATIVREGGMEIPPTAEVVLRRGLVEQYLSTVTRTTADGNLVIQKGAFDTFWRTKSQSMRQFFSPKEIAALRKPETATRAIRIMQNREKEIVGSLNKSFSMRMQQFDAVSLVDNVIARTKSAGGNADDLVRVDRLLRRDPAMQRAFRSVLKDRIRREIAAVDSAGIQTASAVKLFTLDPKLRAAAEKVLGKKFGQQLDIIQDMLLLGTKRTSEQSVIDQIVTGAPGTTVGTLMVRATIAPPLSRKGRFFTAVLRQNRKELQALFAEIMSSPEALQQFLKMRNKPPGSLIVFDTLTSLGAIDLAHDFQDFDKEQ